VSQSSDSELARPWYREPWPWFLIILLSTVVAAGLVTAWLAFNGTDPLIVSEAEYQQLRAEQKVSESPPVESQDHKDDGG